MNFSARQAAYLYAAGWLLLIYSTLSIVRPICAYLKLHTPFSVLVDGLFGLLVVLVLVFWVRAGKIRRCSTLLQMMAIFIVYGICLSKIKIPEERIHLIEYGILAFLFFRALHFDVKGEKLYALVLVLTSLAGWVDERIQHLLPNRFFQWSDVRLNILSAVLALLLIAVIQKENSLSQQSIVR